jgi:tetratricopeptide (TPR) repeat protein
VKLTPDDALAQFNLGLAELELDQLQNAEQRFKESLRLDPELAGAHVNLGAIHNRRGRFAEAIAACEQALRINPNSAAGHYQLGFAFLKSGQIERGREQHLMLQRMNADLARELTTLLPL